MIAGKSATAGQQEAALDDYVQRLGKHTAGRRALHLRLSALRPQGRQPQRLAIAELAFEVLISEYQGALFRLSNADMVVFFKDASPEVVKRALNYLRNLYAEDPIVRDAGDDLSGFCRHFDLAKS